MGFLKRLFKIDVPIAEIHKRNGSVEKIRIVSNGKRVKAVRINGKTGKVIKEG